MTLPSVPAPPAEIVASEVLASWPESPFLENLAFGPDGALYVTSWLEQELYRLAAPGWTPELIAALDFHPMGIAFASDGTAVLSGHRQPGFDARAPGMDDGFWRLGANHATSLICDAPGARFLNGIARIDDRQFISADSSGKLWQVNVSTGEARIVASGPLLEPSDSPIPIPGANGIKLRHDAVYVSNWARGLILRAPLSAPSQLTVVAEELMVDDFAFSENGTLFGATHLDSVVRLDPGDERRTIAERSEQVHGCTACAFAPSPGEPGLYVITDGGAVAGTPEPARLVRLEVPHIGQPLV